LVGLRCNAGVVRQRQVVACHQTSNARFETASRRRTPAWARWAFSTRS